MHDPASCTFSVVRLLIGGRTDLLGPAWCDNREHYSDFSNRLPQGRVYVRNGSVIDLQIPAGVATVLTENVVSRYFQQLRRETQSIPGRCGAETRVRFSPLFRFASAVCRRSDSPADTCSI